MKRHTNRTKIRNRTQLYAAWVNSLNSPAAQFGHNDSVHRFLRHGASAL